MSTETLIKTRFENDKLLVGDSRVHLTKIELLFLKKVLSGKPDSNIKAMREIAKIDNSLTFNQIFKEIERKVIFFKGEIQERIVPAITRTGMVKKIIKPATTEEYTDESGDKLLRAVAPVVKKVPETIVVQEAYTQIILT